MAGRCYKRQAGAGIDIICDDDPTWDENQYIAKGGNPESGILAGAQEMGIFGDVVSGKNIGEYLEILEGAQAAETVSAEKDALRQEGIAAAKGATAAVEKSAQMIEPLARQEAGRALMAAMSGTGGMAAGGARAASLAGAAQQSAAGIQAMKSRALQDLAGQKLDEILYRAEAGSGLEDAMKRAKALAAEMAGMGTKNERSLKAKGIMGMEPEFVRDAAGNMVKNPVWVTAKTYA